MNKRTTIIAAAFAVIFSGSAFSSEYNEVKQRDIFWGDVNYTSSKSQSHEGVHAGNYEVKNYLMWNIEKADPASGPAPYVRAEDNYDRDIGVVFPAS